MPAYIAHYTCGVMAKRRVFGMSEESQTAKSLAAHPNVYHVGLAGPDLFFYSLYETVRPGLKIGRAMHKYRTDQFLQALYREAVSRKGEDGEIALAYFAGFMGHYCLDTSAHPVIYRICHDEDEKIALGKHFRYEAAMDVNVCRYYLGRDVNAFDQGDLIHLTHREKWGIARVLSAAIRKIYPDTATPINPVRLYAVLTEYEVIARLLVDRSGFKEWCYLGFEKLIRGYSLMSSLFINGNVYGLSRYDFDKFDRRFRRGEQKLEKLLPMLDAALCDEAQESALFAEIGSRSYHTGRMEDGRETEIDW